MKLLPFLGPLLQLVTTGLGAWLVSIINHQANHDVALKRANALAQIATDAAALVVASFPGKPWAVLLDETVKAIASAAGLPTTDQQAIERAAAGALTKLGKAPTQ